MDKVFKDALQDVNGCWMNSANCMYRTKNCLKSHCETDECHGKKHIETEIASRFSQEISPPEEKKTGQGCDIVVVAVAVSS